MKKIIFAILFTTSTAIACPNLSGTYACINEDGEKEITAISQELRGNTTVYRFLTEGEVDEFIADGKTRIDYDNEGRKTAVCKSGILNALIEIDFIEEGTKLGFAKADINLFKEGINLRMVGEYTIEFWGDIETNEINETCNRL